MIKLLLLSLLLVPLCLAAKKSAYEQIIELADASKDGVIQLNDDNFGLLTASRREWSVIVQFTALDKKMKCAPCKEFDPSFHAVAKAWKTVPKAERNRHFFASIDFANGEKTFKKLSIMSAPVATYYPANDGPNRPENGKVEPFSYDFNNYGKEPKELAVLLSQFTSVPIPYSKPIDWGFVLTVVTTITMLALMARLILPVLINKWTWAAITLMTILVMISGFMFVRIRGSAYRNGDTTMIPGYQNQLGAEIWIVSSKYFILSAAFLVLIIGAPQQTKPMFQQYAIYLSSLIIVLMFSALIKDFKIKNGGYPFSYIL